MGENDLESIVHRVTLEVWRELAKQGIALPTSPSALPDGAVKIDMSRYRTPLLTERALAGLHPSAHTVVVPKGTIVTPRAKDFMREKRIGMAFD